MLHQAAAEAASDQSDDTQLPDAAPLSPRLTVDVDDTLADLTSTAVAANAQPDASAESSVVTIGVIEATELSLYTVPSSPEIANLAHPEDAEPAEYAMLTRDEEEVAGLAPSQHAAPAEPAEPAVLDLHEDVAGLGAAVISGMAQEDSVTADVDEAVVCLTDAALQAEHAAGAEHNPGMVTV